MRRFLAALRPAPATWSAATRATFWGTVVLYVAASIAEVAGGGWRNAANFLTLALLPIGLAVVTGIVALLVRWVGRAPTTWVWAFLSGMLLFALLLMTGEPGMTLLAAAGTVLGLGLMGGGLSAVRTSPGLGWRVAAGFWLLVGIVPVGGLVGVMLWSAPIRQPVINAAGTPSRLVPALALPDPATRGSFPVKTLTYGSGKDLHRPEFGTGAALHTLPFDGSRLVEHWKGRAGWARTRFWGLDAKRLPIQARVYYPDGPGPFPLVLAVHGNHAMEDYSDPGYGYLGELLASRGFVFASVDENFLNSSLSDLMGIPHVGLDEENDLRGVVLLEHLRAWRRFNADTAGPFHAKVDLDRVALIGHSRGGEAVSVAAAFNRLPADPDDGRVKFDYGFGIRAVVAIAQVDGQYEPAKQGTPITDVNYLALHGSYDGDVTTFDGLRQWNRVRLDGDGYRIKAAVYVHGANHGQFNTTWGRDDQGGLRGRMLNLAAIMPADSQRRVAQVYISTFLEATLRDRWEYLPVFRDARAGAAWLPTGIYLTRLATSKDRVIASYQEDIDLGTTTMPGGAITGENLADWREQLVSLKSGDQATRAVFLGWNRKEWPGVTPQYEIRLPDSVVTSATTQLVFDLADAKKDPSPRDPDKEPGKDSTRAKEEKPRQPVDFTVEVIDRAGHSAKLPLSAIRAVQPQLEARLAKLAFLNPDPNSEPVFQSYGFPLGAFTGVDPTRLRAVRFLFDRTGKGMVVVDGVGLRN